MPPRHRQVRTDSIGQKSKSQPFAFFRLPVYGQWKGKEGAVILGNNWVWRRPGPLINLLPRWKRFGYQPIRLKWESFYAAFLRRRRCFGRRLIIFARIFILRNLFAIDPISKVLRGRVATLTLLRRMASKMASRFFSA